MTVKALRDVFEKAKHWPEEDQGILVRYAQEIEAHRSGIYALTPEEIAAIEEGSAQADRGEFATEDDMQSLRKRFGGA